MCSRESHCAELSIARITQSWHDVRHLIQVAVDGGEENVDFGMSSIQSVDSLGRRDQADELDAFEPPFLEQRDGGAGRAA